MTGRELCWKLYREAVNVKVKDPYWLISVAFPSGSSYWLAEQDDHISLSLTEDKAKVFLTQGSAERFILKLKIRYPLACQRFEFKVSIKGQQ